MVHTKPAMPAGVVKRGRGRPRKTPAPVSASASINSFAKVSKTSKLSTKTEAALNAAVCAVSETPITTKTPVKNTRCMAIASAPPSVVQPAPASTQMTRKRKAATVLVTSDTEDDVVPSTSPYKKSSSTPATKRSRRSNGSPQQQNATSTKKSQPKGQLTFVRASSTDSDLSVANTTLSRLRLGGASATVGTNIPSLSQSLGSSSYATPTTSDTDESDSSSVPAEATSLPQDLEDVSALFEAFLKTLSLNATYASGGAVECKTLLPDIARAWGKRSVTTADILLLIGILEYGGRNKNAFKLVDYGHGNVKKFHVEICPDMFPLNEPVMRTVFENTLRTLWHMKRGNYFDATAFLAALPRANVVKNPVSRLVTTTTSPSKGQQTLEAFRASMRQKKEEAAEIAAKAATAATAAAEKTKLAKAKPLSVLDRVRAKQSVLERLASSPSQSSEAIARRRCLAKCPEVAGVLGMMCMSSRAPGGPMARISFPMSVVVEKLKDSLGMNISMDEGVDTVRILGREVAPQWVKTLTVVGKEHIVMTRGFAVTRAEVERRVGALIG